MKNLLNIYNQNKDLIQYVAFDIFDTILTRKIYPEYVKKIWALSIKEKLNVALSVEEIYAIRNKLEAEICQNNQSKGFDLEFNYYELVEKMYEELKNQMSCAQKEFKQIAVETEVEVELRVQVIDQDWLEALKVIKEEGKKIILISDFYLPKDMIISILEKHGVFYLIDEVFISCEPLLTKRSGRFYDYVTKEIGVAPNQILMVGDNKHSDYEMARNKGLHSYNIDRIKQHEFYGEHQKKIDNKKNIIDEVVKSSNRTKDSFFEEIVFSLYSYIDKLYNDLVKDKVKNVFFLSREGEFLKVLFDVYLEKQGIKKLNTIKSHYLIVSRKSTFLPSLKCLEVESFENLFRQYRRISLYDFLSSLNFDNELIEQIATQLMIDKNFREEDFPTSETFNKLKNLELFIQAYEDKRIKQNEYFKQYVNQFGFNVEEEGLSLVDVGWKGTIQDNIYNIFDGQVKIKGYYTGLVALGAANETNQKIGILFENIQQKTQYYDVFNENRALFEILLAASHGSANGYELNNNQVIPLTYHEQKERELYEGVIKTIQNNILEKFITILEKFALSTINYEDYKEEFAKIHAKMVFYPTNKEIEFFRKMYHFENFGVFQYTTFDKNNLTLKQKIDNFIVLVRNPRGIFERGFWGPITLEDEGLAYFKKLYGYYRYNKNFGKKDEKI